MFTWIAFISRTIKLLYVAYKIRNVEYFIIKRIKSWFYITKTCLYKVDPLKPHFYIVKLGFTGVYIIFLISAQKT